MSRQLAFLFILSFLLLSENIFAQADLRTALHLSEAIQKKDAAAFFSSLSTLTKDCRYWISPYSLTQEYRDNPFLRPIIDSMYVRYLLTPIELPKEGDDKERQKLIEHEKELTTARKKLADAWERMDKVGRETGWTIMNSYNSFYESIQNTKDRHFQVNKLLKKEVDRFLLQLPISAHSKEGITYLNEFIKKHEFTTDSLLNEIQDDTVLTNAIKKYKEAVLSFDPKDNTKRKPLVNGSLPEQLEDYEKLEMMLTYSLSKAKQWEDSLISKIENGKGAAFSKMSLGSQTLKGLGAKAEAPTQKTITQYGSESIARTGSFEAQMLTALTELLAARLKEELTLSFFQNIQKNLTDSTSKHAKKWKQMALLFPTTVDNLTYVSSTADGNYIAALPTLRIAFAQDLHRIPFSLNDLLVTELGTANDSIWSADQKHQLASLALYLRILDAVSQGEHLSEILSNTSKYLLEPSRLGIKAPSLKLEWINNAKLTQTLELLGSISNLLLDPQVAQRRWISRTSFDKMFDTKVKKELALGVLYEVVNNKPNIVQTSPSSLKLRLSTEAGFRSFSDSLISVMSQISSAYDSLQPKNVKGDVKAVDLLPYYQSIMSLSDFTSTQVLQIPDNTPWKFRSISQDAFDAYYAALEGRYDVMTMKMNGLLQSMLPDTEKTRYSAFMQYAPSFATMAQAKDQETFNLALRNVAAPPGSAGIKRRLTHSWSINCFVGLNVGIEGSPSAARKDIDHLGFTFGPSGLVGVAHSWSPSFWKRKGTSKSIFVSLLDLGAPVSYSLQGNTEALPEDIGFSQVLAPGLYLVHGFANYPFSLLGGVQANPNLRRYIGSSSTDRSVFRFSLGIAVDIPFINFYGKSNY